MFSYLFGLSVCLMITNKYYGFSKAVQKVIINCCFILLFDQLKSYQDIVAIVFNVLLKFNCTDPSVVFEQFC